MYYSESQTDVSQKQEWQQHKKNMFGLFYCLLNFEFSSSSGIAVLPNPPPSHCVCRLDVYAILFYSVLFEDIVIIVEDDGPLSSTIRRINIIFSIKIFWQESFFFCVFLFFCLLLIWCCRCVYFFPLALVVGCCGHSYWLSAIFSVKLNFAAGDRAVEKSECHFVKSSPAELSWTPHDRFSFVSVVFVVVVVVTVPGCPRIRHLRSWSISNRSSVRSFRNDWTTQRLGRENQYKLITIISKLYTLNGK